MSAAIRPAGVALAVMLGLLAVLAAVLLYLGKLPIGIAMLTVAVALAPAARNAMRPDTKTDGN